MADQVVITGIRETRARLRALDNGAHREMRPAWNQAAKLLVDNVRPLVPRDSGTAAASLRVASTQTQGRIRAGGKKAPYYPWLDFGGRVGRRKRTVRPYKRDGRYIFPTLRRLRSEIQRVAQKAINDLIRKHGLEP